MKIKTYFEALQISEALKRLNIDPTTLNPNDRVKIKDGCLVFEGEKECFVSAKNSVNEELTKQRYFLDLRGGCGAVRDSLHKDYNPNYPGLHHDTSDVVEFRMGYRGDGCWNMKQDDIDYLTNLCNQLNEPSGNSEQLEYYYLKANYDRFKKGDETVLSKNSVNWVPVLDEYFGGMYTNDYFPVRRKIQKNPTS